MSIDKVEMKHGAGGEGMQKLIKEIILARLGGASENNPKIELALNALDDSAVVDGIVFTTDSHTVKPLFFPGGDIGSLSVAGTINDTAVMGANPIALSCGLLIEEGFSGNELDNIFESMASASKDAGVPIVTGDTKVVEKGALEGLFINTSGIGTRSQALEDNMQIVSKDRGKIPPR